MIELLDRRFSDADAFRRVTVVATQRPDGDVHPRDVDPSSLLERQRAASGRHWAMLDQVHGTTVVDLDRVAPDGSPATARPACALGDVLHTDTPGRHVAVWAADCAEVFLVSHRGRMVAAHAGWRGLAAGVLDAALDAVGGGEVVAAVLGPVIHPCCYEFGRRDLCAVERGVRARPGSISGVTSQGSAALDVPAAVASALGTRGITLDVVGPCTGCDPMWFSHRVRGDTARHATVAWMSR